MLDLGFSEIVLIFFLFLILFGPKELPGLARFIVRILHELKTIFRQLEKEWKLNATKQNTSSSGGISKSEK